jgi:NAD(P)-dependent dehydrogenase (short-subunit alcohol dehydrogenase family)
VTGGCEEAYSGADMAARETTVTGARLSGRRCIVTGAARGIGAEIAATFRAHGATLGLLDLDPAVKERADELDASAAVADVGDVAALTGALEQLIADLDGVDVLVNNAGILRITALLDITIDEWDLVHDINARSVLVGTQVAARSMIAASDRDPAHVGAGEISGKIINMSSMGAKRGGANQAHYAASKAAVLSLTQVSAVELGPHGITVNAICPGGFMTEPNQRWARENPEVITSFRSQIPLGEYGQPEDLGPLAVYLASDASRYMTGATLVIDGGYTLL